MFQPSGVQGQELQGCGLGGGQLGFSGPADISGDSRWWQLKYAGFLTILGEDEPILTNICFK